MKGCAVRASQIEVIECYVVHHICQVLRLSSAMDGPLNECLQQTSSSQGPYCFKEAASVHKPRALLFLAKSLGSSALDSDLVLVNTNTSTHAATIPRRHHDIIATHLPRLIQLPLASPFVLERRILRNLRFESSTLADPTHPLFTLVYP